MATNLAEDGEAGEAGVPLKVVASLLLVGWPRLRNTVDAPLSLPDVCVPCVPCVVSAYYCRLCISRRFVIFYFGVESVMIPFI